MMRSVMSSLAFAAMMLVSGLVMDVQTAEAGCGGGLLGGLRARGCGGAPAACAPAPSCGGGLLAKLQARKASSCCGEAAPACCEPAPTCGGREGLLAKLKARRAAKSCCGEPAPTCCEAPALAAAAKHQLLAVVVLLLHQAVVVLLQHQAVVAKLQLLAAVVQRPLPATADADRPLFLPVAAAVVRPLLTAAPSRLANRLHQLPLQLQHQRLTQLHRQATSQLPNVIGQAAKSSLNNDSTCGLCASSIKSQAFSRIAIEAWLFSFSLHESHFLRSAVENSEHASEQERAAFARISIHLESVATKNRLGRHLLALDHCGHCHVGQPFLVDDPAKSAGWASPLCSDTQLPNGIGTCRTDSWKRSRRSIST